MIYNLIAVLACSVISTAVCSYLYLLRPITKRLRESGDLEHCFVKHKTVSAIVWMAVSIPATPLLLKVLLSNKLTETFKEHVFNATK